MLSFSNRLSSNLLPNELSRLARETRSAEKPLLDLTVSNPSSVLLDYPHAEIQRAFSSVERFGYSPDPWGIESARQTIAKAYALQGYAASSADIALTASTSEAYSLLFKLFGDAGQEVLIPAPSYPLFEFLAALEGVRVVPYQLLYDGVWSIDFEDLENKVSASSRAIVIVNPNNPTGSFLKQWEVAELLRVAASHDLPVIADEVFMPYAFEPDRNRIATLIGHDEVLSFSLNGLSKLAGMPQMKLAWMVINGPASAKQAAAERLEILLDTYLSVNTPVQLALAALLDTGVRLRSQLLAISQTNYSEAKRVLEGTPAHVLHTEGGWSAIIQLPRTRAEEEWLFLLLEQGVLLQPGYFFDMPSEAFAVASLITPPEDFKEGLTRLRNLVTQP